MRFRAQAFGFHFAVNSASITARYNESAFLLISHERVLIEVQPFTDTPRTVLLDTQDVIKRTNIAIVALYIGIAIGLITKL